MATASVTNTFVASTTIAAARVNENFSDLVSFLNASVVHVDGSKAMADDWSMGGNLINSVADPVSAQDAATKAYVDAHAAVTTTHGISAFGATLVDDATVEDARTTLGLGSLATLSNVSASELGASAVTTAKINDGAVTEAKIAAAAKDTQYHTEANVGDDALTSTVATVVTQTITPDYTGIALVIGTFDFSSSGSSGSTVAQGLLQVGGSTQTSEAIFYAATPGARATVSQAWIVAVTAGVSTTFNLRVKENNADNTPAYTCNADHTTMNIVFLRS